MIGAVKMIDVKIVKSVGLIAGIQFVMRVVAG